MSNIATVLKGEISRLSNKAARQHVAPVHQTTVLLRKQVALLRKQVQALQRELTSQRKQAARAAAPVEPDSETAIRFTAKGLRSLRSRLALSAEDFGRLVGVSGQTVYSWEREKSLPRRSQLPAIAALRHIGKREARARLEALASSN